MYEDFFLSILVAEFRITHKSAPRAERSAALAPLDRRTSHRRRGGKGREASRQVPGISASCSQPSQPPLPLPSYPCLCCSVPSALASNYLRGILRGLLQTDPPCPSINWRLTCGRKPRPRVVLCEWQASTWYRVGVFSVFDSYAVRLL